MPWKSKDARRHTRKATTAKRRRQWSHVANSVLARTGDEARAVRSANAAVGKGVRKMARRKKRGGKRHGKRK